MGLASGRSRAKRACRGDEHVAQGHGFEMQSSTCEGAWGDRGDLSPVLLVLFLYVAAVLSPLSGGRHLAYCAAGGSCDRSLVKSCPPMDQKEGERHKRMKSTGVKSASGATRDGRRNIKRENTNKTIPARARVAKGAREKEDNTAALQGYGGECHSILVLRSPIALGWTERRGP